MKRLKSLALTFALALAASALLVGHIPASFAQQGQRNREGTRKPPCGCYVCGKLLFVTFGDKNCAGILAEDACGGTLGGLPPEKRAGFCQRLTAQFGSASFNGACRAYAQHCGPGTTSAQSPASRGAASPGQFPPFAGTWGKGTAYTPGQFPPFEGTWGKGTTTNTPGQFPPVDGSPGKGTTGNTPQ